MLQQIIISSLAMLLVAVCLRASLRLLYGARGPAPDDGIYLSMRILSLGLLASSASALFIAGANWLSLVLFVALLEATFEMTLGRRAIQRQAAWKFMVSALAAGRHPAEVLRLHDWRFTGIVGRSYRRLVGDLDRGVDWREAVAANHRALPPVASAAAGLVEPGSPKAAHALETDSNRDAALLAVRQQLVQRGLYLGSVLLTIGAVVVFTLIKIIPSYQAIFADFDLELPTLTLMLIGTSNFSATVLALPLIALASLAFGGGIAIAVCYLADFPVLNPLFDRLAIQHHRAQLFQLLAIACERRQPIHSALRQLAYGMNAYPSRIIRRRIGKAARRAEAGADWSKALRESNLASQADVALIESAERTGNLPWALRLLADRKVRVMVFRWTIVQQVLFTVIVLILGIGVFWFAAAMLLPLMDLITNLSM